MSLKSYFKQNSRYTSAISKQRSSRTQIFCKKSILKNFLKPATLLKKSCFIEHLQLLLLKYTYEDAALSFFILALKENGRDKNYDNNIEIVLNFELPIVAEIALPRQNEIFQFKNLSQPFNFYHEFFTPFINSRNLKFVFYPVTFIAPCPPPTPKKGPCK